MFRRLKHIRQVSGTGGAWAVLVFGFTWFQMGCHGEFKELPKKESAVALNLLNSTHPKGLFYLKDATTSRELGVGKDQFCTRMESATMGEEYIQWDDFNQKCHPVYVIPLTSSSSTSETPQVMAWLVAGPGGGPHWNGQAVLVESVDNRVFWAQSTAAAKRARAKVCSSGGACALDAPIYYRGEVYSGGCLGLGPKSWLLVFLLAFFGILAIGKIRGDAYYRRLRELE